MCNTNTTEVKRRTTHDDVHRHTGAVIFRWVEINVKRDVMRTRTMILSLGLVALLYVGCSDAPTSAPNTTTTPPPSDQPAPVSPDRGVEHFRSLMNGAQEIPSVTTRAGGTASFRISNDSAMLMYAVTVSNIMNVAAAHIHIGAVGESGPPVADLFAGTRTGAYNGLLAQGSITADDLKGPLAGQTIASLGDLMASGRAYVNVHTTAYPGGEIRGQIRATPDDGGR